MPFLLPHLRCIKKVHPDAKNIVYYSGITPIIMPNTEYRELQTKTLDKHALLNDRMLAWEMGCKDVNGPVVPIDVDIMLLKPIGNFIAPDITYTYRENHRFPINLGILLLYRGTECYQFMKQLKELTFRIYHSKHRQKARQNFGSCDQRAMVSMINQNRLLRINGIPCRVLNEVDSNLTEDTHAVHYKTSWHPILLDNQPQTDPKKQKLYDLWLSLQE